MSAVVTGFDPLIEADVTIWLRDVTPAGLLLKAPANAKTAGNCSALNAKTPDTCAGPQ